MKKVITLTILSVLMVFIFTSSAFASISIYPNYSPESDYPTILNIGPSSISASVVSDSKVESVNFAVYNSDQNQEEPCLVLNADSDYPGQSWWTVNPGDVDWAPGNYRIEATAANENGETAGQTSYFKIQAENILRGSIVSWSNTPLKYSTVYLHQMDQEPWSGISGWTDENGRFAIFGIAGGTYQVSAYTNNDLVNLGTVTLNVDNTVVTVSDVSGNVSLNNGKLVVTMAKPKVAGRLLRNGMPFANAGMSIRKEGSDYEYYWTNTDKEGYFGLSLADGNYVITEVNTYKPGGDYTRIELNKTFTVSDSTDLGDIAVPGINVSGGLIGLKAPAYGSPELMYGINLTFINMDAGDFEPNKYYWNNARWDDAAGQYSFGLYLPGGNYKVQGYASGQQLDLADEFFTVSGEENNFDVSASQGNKIVTVDNGSLAILIPADNVTGAVQDANGGSLSNAWLTIKKADAAEDDWNAYKWICADENGKFSLYLRDGSYIVTQIYYDGIVANPNQQFEVSGSTEVAVTVGQ